MYKAQAHYTSSMSSVRTRTSENCFSFSSEPNKIFTINMVLNAHNLSEYHTGHWKIGNESHIATCSIKTLIYMVTQIMIRRLAIVINVKKKI